MAGYSYPDSWEKNREFHKDRVAQIVAKGPAEPDGESMTPQRLLAKGKDVSTVTREEYIKQIKVASAVEAIERFREDVKQGTVPGDQDDLGMAAYMVMRKMQKQAEISKTHGYFMPREVKEGLAWLQHNFAVAPAEAPTAPLGLGDAAPRQQRPPPPGHWGLTGPSRRDVGTVEDSNPSDPVGSIVESEMARKPAPQTQHTLDGIQREGGGGAAPGMSTEDIESEMRRKYPEMFAQIDGKQPADGAEGAEKVIKPGAPGPPGPLDRPPANYTAGSQSASPWTEADAMPGADTDLPHPKGSHFPKAPEDPDDPLEGGGGGAAGALGGAGSGVAGLNETLNRLSGELGGAVPAGKPLHATTFSSSAQTSSLFREEQFRFC